MSSIFKNKYYFFILFFIILFIDIYVKLVLEVFPYRYISKPIIMLSIFIYYLYSLDKINTKKEYFFLIGIVCFLIGDLFLIDESNQVLFMLGMFSFIIGKFLYIKCFSNENDFKIIRLIPLLLFSFVYVVFLLRFIYDGLGSFFLPTVIYYFTSQLLLLMAYLRLNAVDYSSFIFVLLGVISFIISETLVALSIFYVKMEYQDSTIMLFYGISQLFIAYGIINEKGTKKDNNKEGIKLL